MLAVQEEVLIFALLILAANSAGVPPSQTEAQAAVRYQKGDCIYETVACLYDDSCGPLLRIVYAYCYETPDFVQDRTDGSRLECDSSCSILLSVLFNTSAGARLNRCNYSSHQFWTQIVVQKQRACAGLLNNTDGLLQRALAGQVRTECWLAGLLCARDFACRSTLMALLDLPCYDGPCSPHCAARLTNFAEEFGDIFHTFLNCLCGQELSAACVQPASGYLDNRSAALDQIGFVSPLDGLVNQLGRGVIKEHMQNIVWLLKVFEHPFYCRSIQAIINDAACLPKVKTQPTVSEPLCAIQPVFELPSSTSTTTHLNYVTTPSSTAGSTAQQSVSVTDVLLETKWRQSTDRTKGAAASGPSVSAGFSVGLNRQLERKIVCALSLLIFLTTKAS